VGNSQGNDSSGTAAAGLGRRVGEGVCVWGGGKHVTLEGNLGHPLDRVLADGVLPLVPTAFVNFPKARCLSCLLSLTTQLLDCCCCCWLLLLAAAAAACLSVPPGVLQLTLEILRRYIDLENKFIIGWLMKFPGGGVGVFGVCVRVGGVLCGRWGGVAVGVHWQSAVVCGRKLYILAPFRTGCSIARAG